MAVKPELAFLNPNRREALRTGAAGLLLFAGGAGEAFAETGPTIVVTPALTEGPYFVDERLNRSDIRIDPFDNSVRSGFPVRLGVTVSRLSGGVVSPLTGATVDLWHCDAAGVYSDVSAQSSVGRKFLRGYQVTNLHGNAQFLTVYPGWYSGRAVHMHYKVRLFNGNQTSYEFTSQLFFNEVLTTSVYSLSPYASRPNRDTLNTTDGIFNQGGGTNLILRMGRDGTSAVASFHVVLNNV